MAILWILGDFIRKTITFNLKYNIVAHFLEKLFEIHVKFNIKYISAGIQKRSVVARTKYFFEKKVKNRWFIQMDNNYCRYLNSLQNEPLIKLNLFN